MAKPATNHKPASDPKPQGNPSASKPLDAYLVETFPDRQTGEEKRKYHQIGNVVPHRTGEGMTLYITPGMSVHGEIVIFPRKDKERGADDSAGN